MDEYGKLLLNFIMKEATDLCFTEREQLCKEKLVYYYTDIDALLNGIIVDNPTQDEEICLWATRCTHLNDKKELVEGIDKLKELISKVAINRLRKDTCKGHSLSFSRKRDSLPMWSMYGKNGTGVMLAFKTAALVNKYGDRFQPCIYTGTKYDTNVFNIMKYRKWGDEYSRATPDIKLKVIVCMCSQYIMLLKNGAFEYEDECRVIGIGFPYLNSEKERQTFYRNKNSIITPYIKEYLPKTALQEIWLGPNNNPKLSKETLEEFLKSKGLSNVKVKTSKVPYRG